MQLSNLTSTLAIRVYSTYCQIRQQWVDILLLVLIALVAGLVSYQLSQMIDPILFDKQAGDVWFHSDIGRIFEDITIYEAEHWRTNVHPLFLLIVFPIVYVIKTVFLVEPLVAARLFTAGVTALWLSSLFILLRLIGCHRFDSMLFTILASTSAAAVFWFVVVETYPLGSWSIVLALGVVVLGQNRQLSPLLYIFVTALTLSITVTNAMVGILATIVNYRWKQSFLITLKGFSIVAGLIFVQKVIFPTSNAGGFFSPTRMMQGEASYIITPDSGSVMKVFKSFIFDTLVMPKLNFVNNRIDVYPLWPIRMSVQTSSPGSGTIWGAIAIVLWIALLSLGVWALFSMKKHLQLRVVLGFALLGQLALHIIYGEETFLYTLHFLPLLVVLVALTTLTRVRVLALALAGLLALSAGINNSWQISRAMEFVQNHHTQLCASALAKCKVDKIISSPQL